MAILSGFEVRIKSNGEYLTEYNDPANNAQGNRDNIVKYIEAVSGARFSVNAALTTEFRYAGAVGVVAGHKVAGHKIDGLQRRWYLCSKSYGGPKSRYSLTHLVSDRKEAGRYEREKFAFGQLSTATECDDHCSAMDFGDGEWLGSISVEFYRVTFVPRASFAIKWGKDALVATVPEKLLKGKAIDQTVNMVEGVPCEPEMSAPWKSTRLPDRAGRRKTITFFYRSKRALQIIGCIPRDPSPPTIPATGATDDEVVEVDSKAAMTPRQAPTLEQELRKLRTRVRELESRQTSVKRETTPLKRERSPEDIYGSTPKRGRSKLGAPVIDLTDE